MKKLKSWLCGRWQEGEGEEGTLFNPATDEALATASTRGLDFKAALEFARSRGGPGLREMTFAERGACLKSLSKAIHEHREELLDLATANGGNTRSDAKFDVDGGTGTLMAYAGFARGLGDEPFLREPGSEQLTRNPRYVGLHLWTPLKGAAVHVNAYNFPAWGFLEKAAVALLAGVPVITKPATSTAIVAVRIMEIIAESKLLPEGALQLIAGRTGDLVDHLGAMDVLAFTGSSGTAGKLRGLPAHVERSMRINIEADSLNAAVLGADVEPGSETWSLAMREIVTDVRQKTGQKCTAIRRVFAPRDKVEAVCEALREELMAIKVGNPADSSVRMGPLVSKSQVEDVRQGIAALEAQATKVCGEANPTGLIGVEDGKGCFVTPHVFRVDDAGAAPLVHEREVFGPVVSVVAVDSPEQAAELVALGDGGLVSSLYTDDRDVARRTLLAMAPYHGRLTHGSKKVADHSLGPGMVMPAMVHGGPGRAGGGEELGGERGLRFYMQRTAIQGYGPLLERFFPEASKGD